MTLGGHYDSRPFQAGSSARKDFLSGLAKSPCRPELVPIRFVEWLVIRFAAPSDDDPFLFSCHVRRIVVGDGSTGIGKGRGSVGMADGAVENASTV